RVALEREVGCALAFADHGLSLVVLPTRALEDHEHGELLVGGEAMLDTCLDEDRFPDLHRHTLVSNLEHAGAVEPDVDLVVGVRLLAVRLRGDEDVDAELEPGRLMDDLVAAARAAPTLDDVAHTERVHG